MIPGLVDSSWEFSEAGRVTLSTIYRAKGNEAPVVYIFASEKLYDYVGEVENRNRVFTAMSRSKGWVRMTGVGAGMKRLEEEIGAIEADFLGSSSSSQTWTLSESSMRRPHSANEKCGEFAMLFVACKQ